jgi:hypothetical protein
MANAQRRATDLTIKAPRLMPRHNAIAQSKLRLEAQSAFLHNFELSGSIRQAAIDTEIDRLSHYRWLESDPKYAELWEAAQEGFTQNLEAHAAKRATVGVPRGVYFQGQKVGSEQWVSDPLLMFLLKGRRPDTYRDRTEITGANGGPLQVQAVRPDSLSRLTDQQLDALAALNGLAPLALTAVAITSQDEPQDIDAHAVDEDADGAEGHAQAPTTLPAPDPGASRLDGLDSPAEPGDEPGE